MGKLFNRSPASLSSFSKVKRGLALGIKRSPLFSWRYNTHNVDQLLLVPRDLRTADPSLSIELDMGQFGLAGATVFLNGASPLRVAPPNLSWTRELHGFSWVRNLRAARTDRAQEQAMELMQDWLQDFSSQKGIAWEPEVSARRLISWLSHSNFLLYEAEDQAYLDMMSSIDNHMRFLSMTGMQASEGMPRLLSLIALMFAGLCVNDQEKFADQHVWKMCDELDKQILPDGGHISRDNSVLASILLDLLPLKQCFITRNLEPPQQLTDAINRMLPMINYMRLGDGLMSRFNGAGTTLPDTLSTAMAYDDVANTPLNEAPYSHYYRLQKGNVIVLMDGGTPAKLGLTANSHAGCLSFEMSSGTCPMIVNCGAAPPAYQNMASNARASVSHSTLTINNRSSGQFVHDVNVKNSDQPSLLDGPGLVKASYEKADEISKIIGSHDGYLNSFGLIHHRLISLSHDGYSLIGEDWIEAQSGAQDSERKLGWPFAVHFHIHPDVETTRAGDGKSITLILPDSQVWEFSAKGKIIYLEESTFYADFAGPCQSVQAVIRGNCVGNTSIPWLLAKVVKTQSEKPPKVPAWISENIIPLDQAPSQKSEDGLSPKKDEDKSSAQKVKTPAVKKSKRLGKKLTPPPPPVKTIKSKVTELVEDFEDSDIQEGTWQEGTWQEGTWQEGTRQEGTRQEGTRQEGTRQEGTRLMDRLPKDDFPELEPPRPENVTPNKGRPNKVKPDEANTKVSQKLKANTADKISRELAGNSQPPLMPAAMTPSDADKEQTRVPLSDRIKNMQQRDEKFIEPGGKGVAKKKIPAHSSSKKSGPPNKTDS